MSTNRVMSVIATALSAALLLISATASAATTTVSLTAEQTQATLPGGAQSKMWGYCGGGVDPSGSGRIGTSANCGTAWAPGPTITVPVGDTLVIKLTNNLPIRTSLVILGQVGAGGGLGSPSDPRSMDSPSHATQTTTTFPGPGAADVNFAAPIQGKRVRSFGTELLAGATDSFTWTALRPGTYIYETGTLPSIQVPMGLYGVLIVTKDPAAGAPGYAYQTKALADAVAYDADATLLFSEIDPVQNLAVYNAARAATTAENFTLRFDDPTCLPNCYPAAVNYTPAYFLINGKPFDPANPAASAISIPSTVTSGADGGSVLLRLANAGSRTHIPSVVGLGLELDGEDAHLLPGVPKVQSEVLLTAGKTHDVRVKPTQVSAGGFASRAYAVFDRQLSLSNANTPEGGMLAYLSVANGSATSLNPRAVPDTFTAKAGAATFTGNVTKNDYLVSSVVCDATLTTGTCPTLAADGSFTVNAATEFYYYGVDAGHAKNTDSVKVVVAFSATGGAPVAGNFTFNSALASHYSSLTPGVLSPGTLITASPYATSGSYDPGKYTLKAALADSGNCPNVVVNADGSFSATSGGASSCSFTYTVTNSQGTPSASTGAVTINFLTTGMKSGLVLNVVDAKDGSSVPDYRWTIQEDRTFKHDPSGTTPPGTRTLATSFHRSHMPVVATGCTGPISCGTGQSVRGAAVTPADVVNVADVVLDPTKNYYISVLPADQDSTTPHIMGGVAVGKQLLAQLPGSVASPVSATIRVAHGESMDADGNALLAPAQLSIYIYEDNNPTNGQYDANEVGLGGFNLILVDAVGRSGDVAGQQTFDQFGMPLSNSLLGSPGCPDVENPKTNGTGTSAAGNIVGAAYTCPNAPKSEVDAAIAADAATPGVTTQQDLVAAKYALAGHALIKNVTPARYDVLAHPGAARAGERWWQVETLEGTPAQDAFTGTNEPRYFQEFGPPGFHTTIGMVNPDRVQAFHDDPTNAAIGTYTVKGEIQNQHMARPWDLTAHPAGSYELLNSTICQVVLNSQNGQGPAIAIAQCNVDGDTGKATFHLDNVPAGDYQMVIWDEWLDQIIQTKAVTVNAALALNNVRDLGVITVLSWFTQHDQNIFLDANKNGVFDEGEAGISNVPLVVRYRNGSLSTTTLSDSNGNGILTELFPLFSWYVAEADLTRYKQTGVNLIVDAGGPTDKTSAVADSTAKIGDGTNLWSSNFIAAPPMPAGVSPNGSGTNSSNRVEIPGSYSYGVQSFVSQRNTLNWGRTPYVKNENGGIQGLVVYSSTRPFDDQRINVQTLWEPLVPRVKVNLYRRTVAADGSEQLSLVDTTQTSSWDDSVNLVYGSDNNQYILGSDNVLRDPVTGAVPSGVTAGKQVNMQCPGQDPTDPFLKYTLGTDDQFRCYDGFHVWNQAQPAPYDGRYAFPSAAYVAAHPLASAQKVAGQTLVSLPQGDYVVETVTPPGYEIVKEEDKNIFTGDAFNAPPVMQFGGLGSVFILPDQATLNNANPYNCSLYDANGKCVGPVTNATTNLGVNSSTAVFAECVGTMHRVPDYLTVAPAAQLVAPFAGMDRPLCDRKLVKLGDQMQANTNFFLFTQTPLAANGSGIILDDLTAEWNKSSPDFGEKAAVPFVPVSVKDFAGNELTRMYADQWGQYNMMLPSSWSVNPPTPSGYIPNMLINCMNDPGPIVDPSGTPDPQTGKARMIADPQYNPAFSTFCYTLPFMPGQTTYLDTPVVPVAAFASGYNPTDCAYPDLTPAIRRVDTVDGFGPWVSSTSTGSGNTLAGKTIDIYGIVSEDVQNPAYGGPLYPATSLAGQRTITRHYGFGPDKTPGNAVTVGGQPLDIVAWGNEHITAKFRTGAGAPSYKTGELQVTRGDNKKSTVDAVTVTIESATPKRVGTGGSYSTIQAAIEAAAPNDLLLVNSGVYNELVIMWKPVRLQGVGAASVVITATKYPTSKLELWRPRINELFGIDGTTGDVVNPTPQIDPLPTQEITGGVVLLEPSVLGTEEGAGITVLAKDRANLRNSNGRTPTARQLCTSAAGPGWDSDFECATARIDGISITGSDAGGGIYVNGWAHHLEIANNRLYGNAGVYHGGVRIGVPYLQLDAHAGVVSGGDGVGNVIAGFGFDKDVKIHHNAITKNGTVEGPGGSGGAGGGIAICSGTDGYLVDQNWVCGNFSSSDGGGIGHLGFSQGGKITRNKVFFNQSFQQTVSTDGGGIFVGGEPAIGGTLSLGSGNVVIDANEIRGNAAETGKGGGIALRQINGADVALNNVQARNWNHVDLTNNMVTNNVAGFSGAGLSVSDALNRSTIVNNTIASNDSVGIAGVLLSGTLFTNVGAEGTDVTGFGRPMPAGISADATSAQLYAALSQSERTGNSISNPLILNNVVWQNRSMWYDGQGGLCSGNDGTNTAAASCARLAAQTYSGQCVNTVTGQAPAYWDLGVVGDTSPTLSGTQLTFNIVSATQVVTPRGNNNPDITVTVKTALPTTLTTGSTARVTRANGSTNNPGSSYFGNFTVTVIDPYTFTYSFRAASNAAALASVGAGLVTPSVVGSPKSLTAVNSVLSGAANFAVADQYCNGARITPEVTLSDSPTQPVPSLPEAKNFVVAAAIDEANNYVNLRFGPLYLAKPDLGSAAGTTSQFTAFGDYHLTLASTAAIDTGGVAASALPSPVNGTLGALVKADFDGAIRPTGAAYEIGADEIVVPSPLMVVSPTPLAFGHVSMNTTTTLQVTVANDPAAATNLVLSAPTISNAVPAAGYTVSNGSCTLGAPGLAAGSSCTINVTFAPTASNANYSAVLNVNSTNGGSIQVNVTGRGVTPLFGVTPLAGQNYGNVVVGTSSTAQFTLTNPLVIGDGNLLVTGLPTLAAAPSPTADNRNQFAVSFASGDTCSVGKILAVGEFCTFTVTFAPTSVGAKGTSFTSAVRVNPTLASGTGTGSRVWGAGVVAAVSPTTITFPNTTRGTASAAQTVTLTTSQSLSSIAVAFSGTNASNFRRSTSSAGTCGTTLTAGSSCTINVEFAPPTGGTASNRTATMTVSATGAAAMTVSLSGRAQ